MTLTAVRSFGTEDRIRPDGVRIPPKPEVFKLIVFRGTDIQDLQVESPADVRERGWFPSELAAYHFRLCCRTLRRKTLRLCQSSRARRRASRRRTPSWQPRRRTRARPRRSAQPLLRQRQPQRQHRLLRQRPPPATRPTRGAAATVRGAQRVAGCACAHVCYLRLPPPHWQAHPPRQRLPLPAGPHREEEGAAPPLPRPRLVQAGLCLRLPRLAAWGPRTTTAGAAAAGGAEATLSSSSSSRGVGTTTTRGSREAAEGATQEGEAGAAATRVLAGVGVEASTAPALLARPMGGQAVAEEAGAATSTTAVEGAAAAAARLRFPLARLAAATRCWACARRVGERGGIGMLAPPPPSPFSLQLGTTGGGAGAAAVDTEFDLLAANAK